MRFGYKIETLVVVLLCGLFVACEVDSPVDDGTAGDGPVDDGQEQTGDMSSISDMSVGALLSNAVPAEDGVEIDGVVWQHENVGSGTASSADMLYQWGRSYGQVYGQSDVEVSVGPVSDPESSGSGFLAVSSDPFDWLLSQDNQLWNRNPVCPEGWRLPTRGELSSLCLNHSDMVTYKGNKGRWFSGSTPYSEGVAAVFFPAAGSIGYHDGKAKKTGEEGWYWSSSARDSYVAALYFHDQSVAVGYYFRARGMAVRCCKEGESVLKII